MKTTDDGIMKRIGEIHQLTDEAEQAKEFARANIYYREALDLIPKMHNRKEVAGMEELIRENMKLNVRLAAALGRPLPN